MGTLSFLERLGEQYFVSGGLKDGLINIYDLRQEKIVNKIPLAYGSINSMKQN